MRSEWVIDTFHSVMPRAAARSTARPDSFSDGGDGGGLDDGGGFDGGGFDGGFD